MQHIINNIHTVDRTVVICVFWLEIHSTIIDCFVECLLLLFCCVNSCAFAQDDELIKLQRTQKTVRACSVVY